jgi:hypothetical protein
MKSAYDRVGRADTRPLQDAADSAGRPAPVPAPIASWYAQGISDGLGDRLLMFDNTAAASLELLRLRPTLANAPGFERTLREAVRRLASFKHPSFAQARSVQRLEGDDALAVISTHTDGKRLSDIFRRTDRHAGMHPAFATWLIRQLTSALSDFHAQGDTVAHGALTTDRIVLTPDRRLVITEHVLGAALDERRFSPARLWRDVGIVAVAADDEAPRLNSQGDIVQLGLVALSVLLGRRVTPEDYPGNLDGLLDEFAENAGRRSPTLVTPLRRWLEQALDPAAGFDSALEAGESLSVLGHPGERIAIGAPPIIEQLQVSPIQAVATPEPQVTDMALSTSIDSTETLASPRSVWMDTPAARRFSIVRNAAIGLAVVALVEGVVISQLVAKTEPAPTTAVDVPLTIDSPSAGDRVLVDGREVGVTPLKLTVGSNVRSIRVIARESATAPAPAAAMAAAPTPGDPKTAAALATAAQRQRSGGLRLSTPIELQVLEGERVLGTSADGPIVASAGVHQLDFINAAIGFRSRQTVTIKAGEIIPLKVQPPDGRVSINAQPWAQVWIDGNLVGETPLANVPVAAGEHEITFRHPQLGERRETTIVKSGVQTRVSATLSK